MDNNMEAGDFIYSGESRNEWQTEKWVTNQEMSNNFVPIQPTKKIEMLLVYTA